MKKNIQATLIELLETDTDFSLLNEKKIRQQYLNSSKAEKQIIDSIFINLTGFSLGTLLLNQESTDVQGSSTVFSSSQKLHSETSSHFL